MVIFNQTLKEHTGHFHHVFNLFDKMNIALKPSKSYIGYPTVALLGQKVDNFGFNISVDKLEVIRTIKFPRKFKNIETYVGMTNYLRNYVPYYTQLVKPLQWRKTTLLRNSFIQNNARKAFSKNCKINLPSETEKVFFNVLQAVFSQPIYFVHHDPNRFLHIDVNASKQWGFGTIVYHVKGNKEMFSKNDVEPILFLSRCLTNAETKYWLIEFETTGLV